MSPDPTPNIAQRLACFPSCPQLVLLLWRQARAAHLRHCKSSGGNVIPIMLQPSVESTRAYFNNRLSSVDCIVRELADIGSRLEVPENVTIPNSFELYIPTRDEHFQARVKWRKDNNLGTAWGVEQNARPGLNPALPLPRDWRNLSVMLRSCSGTSQRCKTSDRCRSVSLKTLFTLRLYVSLTGHVSPVLGKSGPQCFCSR